jgi:hypothetical protein
VHFWVFDGDLGVWIEGSSNTDDQRGLLEQWREFWLHVENDMPRGLTEEDSLIREDAAWAAAVDVYPITKEGVRHAQASAQAARRELIALVDHPRVAGAGVKVTRYWQDARMNYEEFGAARL